MITTRSRAGKQGAVDEATQKSTGWSGDLKQEQPMSPLQKNAPISTEWSDSHGTGGRGVSWGAVGRFIHSAVPMFFLSCFPLVAVFMWHICEVCKGDVFMFFNNLRSEGIVEYLSSAYSRPSLTGVTYIAVFGAIEAVFQLCLPGKVFYGPATPKGNVPVYKANGVQSYVATLALFFLGWQLDWFSPSAVYDNLGSILSTSNLFSLILCFALYIKGSFFPSSTDNGSTGSFLFDFYWGRELFPRIGRHFDIKTWTNCRVGMMSWAVLPLCYAIKQYTAYGFLSNSMLVSVFLMEVYVLKFFIWETGYWASMDITHDRAGFYLCWGCLVWVPSVYTSPTMYMVNHPVQLTTMRAIGQLVFGLAMIFVNYDCDRQRQVFRKTHGKCKIWGKTPGKITAKYMTGKGEVRESLLLTSGYWGMARHFHYLPEVLAAFAWSSGTGFGSPVPFWYVTFLTGLLVDRAHRDDERCRAKYGVYWAKYCQIVKRKIIPGVF